MATVASSSSFMRCEPRRLAQKPSCHLSPKTVTKLDSGFGDSAKLHFLNNRLRSFTKPFFAPSKPEVFKSNFRLAAKAEVYDPNSAEILQNSSSDSKEKLIIERESVINTIKTRIVSLMLDSYETEEEKNDFFKTCTQIESKILSWYSQEFEEMMEIYSLFEPVVGNNKLMEQKISDEEIEKLENKFLEDFFHIMEKSNYRLLSAEEFDLAKSGRYLLDFPISVNRNKLDSELFARFFKKNGLENVPEFYDQFVIFRRGIGVERTTNYFFVEKIDIILSKIWNDLITKLGVKKAELGEPNSEIVINREVKNHSNNDKLSIERIRIENMDLNIKTFFSKCMIQEPTFSRMTVLFRKKNTDAKNKNKLEDREISIMHFQQVPMADMEIVLPEKNKPSLAPLDLLRFSVTAIGGLTAFLNFSNFQFNAIFIFAASSYLLKVYSRWSNSLNRYENMINQSMYNKHLDNGKGTLLHLQYETIQQEIKEALIGYYILQKQGPCSMKELDQKCEKFLFDNFEETTDFEVDDALHKLLKLNLVSKEANEIYTWEKPKFVEDQYILGLNPIQEALI